MSSKFVKTEATFLTISKFSLIILFFLTYGCAGSKVLKIKNEKLQSDNRKLAYSQKKTQNELEKTKNECEDIEVELAYIKSQRLDNNDNLRLIGVYKRLENFSDKVNTIECDLPFLRRNFHNSTFIRVATVRKLKYSWILEPLERFGQNVFFAHDDNGMIRIYIGPTRSTNILNQVRRNFGDAQFDNRLTSIVAQKITPTQKIKSVTPRGYDKPVTSPQIEISNPQLAEELLNAIAINDNDVPSRKTNCPQSLITYDYVEEEVIELGKYIFLAEVSNFDCQNVVHCPKIGNLLLIRKPNGRIWILSKRFESLKEIKKCAGFNVKIKEKKKAGWNRVDGVD